MHAACKSLLCCSCTVIGLLQAYDLTAFLGSHAGSHVHVPTNLQIACDAHTTRGPFTCTCCTCFCGTTCRLCAEKQHVSVDAVVREGCKLLGVSSLRELGVTRLQYLNDFMSTEQRVLASIATFLGTRWVPFCLQAPAMS